MIKNPNNHLKEILAWAYKKQETGFLEEDLIERFNLDKTWYIKMFRANFSEGENLICLLPYDDKNNKHYAILTEKGIRTLHNLDKPWHEKLVGKIIFLIMGAIIVILVNQCWNYVGETWQGFYYPNGCLTCQEDYIYSPPLNDRASCLSWATNLKQQRNNPNDTFECGKNCKAPDTKNGAYICKETVDY